MAVFSTAVAFDMPALDLTDLADGDVVRKTPTDWDVIGASTGSDYTFTGDGLTFSGGLPDAGTINDLHVSLGSLIQFQIVGAIDAADLGGFVAANDARGLFEEWFSGNDEFDGSSFNDHLTGFKGNDTFELQLGGEDFASGGKGNDRFFWGNSVSGVDRLVGGKGADTAYIDGDMTVVFDNRALKGIETLHVALGHDYDLSFDDTNLPRNGLVVDGTDLKSDDTLIAQMATVTTKPLIVDGGRGDDDFVGDGGADVFHGNEGNDILFGNSNGDFLGGGAGADIFGYNSAQNSTHRKFDTMGFFSEADGDRVFIPIVIQDVNVPLTTGTLSLSTFDSDLETQIDDHDILGKHDAVLFTPDAGDFAGQTLLLVDFNNHVGYQAGADVVILMSNTSGLALFDEAAFINSL